MFFFSDRLRQVLLYCISNSGKNTIFELYGKNTIFELYGINIIFELYGKNTIFELYGKKVPYLTYLVHMLLYAGHLRNINRSKFLPF